MTQLPQIDPTRAIVPLPQEEKEQIESDIHVRRFGMKLHDEEIQKLFSDDLPLAVLNDKEKDFIMGQAEAALEAIKLIKDEDMAKYAVNRILIKSKLMLGLNRNVIGNPAVEKIISPKPPELMPPTESLDEETLKRLKGKQRGER